MNRLIPLLLLLVVLTSMPAIAAPPPVQVKIDFNSMAVYGHSSKDQNYHAVPAALTAAEKAAILAKAQQKFNESLGPGQVILSEGTGGDIDMIVSGNTNPRPINVYGNVGRPCKPGIVYAGRFQNENFTGVGRTNAIGETLAHEIAHKIGVTGHWENRPDLLMSDGRGLTPALRAADSRPFHPQDAAIMQANLNNPCNEPRRTPFAGFGEAAPAGTEGSGSYAPQMLGDDPGFDAGVTYSGPAGSQYGFISESGDFVFQGDGTLPDEAMGFFYEFPYDFAIRLSDNTVIAVSDPGSHSFELLNPNSFAQPNVYLTLVETFFTPQGSASLTFNVSNPEYGGGFTSVPEPNTASLMAGCAATGLLVVRRRPKTLNC